MADLQERFSVSSSSSLSSLPPSLPKLPEDEDLWNFAEGRAHEILRTIQPVTVSDMSRIEIIDYVHHLIKDRLGIEVFLFGSVPLKTYLPDGDIDLTVLTPQYKEEDLAKALFCLLEVEQGLFDFQVTDVQYVPAQVKVIKCNIRNIAVDISFNQIAGLCALCFLEQVDQMFEKDHLFKRSIILIKAWCYYESRILGANSGLISTYALAVLVLYIINRYHSSLSGPLAVLYKFLDYYSSFDWKNYCITVNGPVAISSLPDISETEDHEVVLNEKFFLKCMETYKVPTKGVGANGISFPIKHFNIMDPLKHSNNLGRSVTIGNVRRIKHAFTLGARKLRDLVAVPQETMGWRLEKFFSGSLERNGKGQRQDVEEPLNAFGSGRSVLSDLKGDLNRYYQSLEYAKWYHGEIQHYWILPGQDKCSWDVVCWVATSQKNVPYWRNLNGSTVMQNMRTSRGTGTYIPGTSQQYYTNKFSIRQRTVNSLAPASQTKLYKQGYVETSCLTN